MDTLEVRVKMLVSFATAVLCQTLSCNGDEVLSIKFVHVPEENVRVPEELSLANTNTSKSPASVLGGAGIASVVVALLDNAEE